MRRYAGISVVLMAVGLVAHAALDKDVLLYLPFDEGSGETTQDLSNSKTDGKLVNKPKWIDGKFGKALEFDGKTNFVQVDQDVNVHVEKGEITLCAWVKPGKMGLDAHGQTRQPVIMKGNANMWEFALYIYDDYGAGLSFWNCGGAGVSEPSAGGNTIPGGDWHAFCASFKVKGTTRIYVDGKLLKEDAGRVGAICENGTRPVMIAHREDGQFLNAAIDEVRIYGRELTAAEVASEMTKPLAGLAVDPRDRLTTTWGTLKGAF